MYLIVEKLNDEREKVVENDAKMTERQEKIEFYKYLIKERRLTEKEFADFHRESLRKK